MVLNEILNYQFLNPTLHVSYFTVWSFGELGNEPVFTAETLCVTFLLSWFWVHFVIKKWLKKTLFISYFTELIFGSIRNWPDIKSDTLV